MLKADVERYGATDECPGCTSVAVGGRAEIAHNSKCRERISKCCLEDDDARQQARYRRFMEKNDMLPSVPEEPVGLEPAERVGTDGTPDWHGGLYPRTQTGTDPLHGRYPEKDVGGDLPEAKRCRVEEVPERTANTGPDVGPAPEQWNGQDSGDGSGEHVDNDVQLPEGMAIPDHEDDDLLELSPLDESNRGQSGGHRKSMITEAIEEQLRIAHIQQGMDADGRDLMQMAQ